MRTFFSIQISLFIFSLFPFLAVGDYFEYMKRFVSRSFIGISSWIAEGIFKSVILIFFAVFNIFGNGFSREFGFFGNEINKVVNVQNVTTSENTLFFSLSVLINRSATRNGVKVNSCFFGKFV